MVLSEGALRRSSASDQERKVPRALLPICFIPPFIKDSDLCQYTAIHTFIIQSALPIHDSSLSRLVCSALRDISRITLSRLVIS